MDHMKKTPVKKAEKTKEIKNNKNFQDIISKLKENNNRITTARTNIIEIFTKSKIPLSAGEIIAKLVKIGINANKTTIYRELYFLMENKILREIDLMDGSKRYELFTNNDHHHHLICNKCKDIKCMPMPNDLDELEKKIAKASKFKITGHVLEFFGICNNCNC